MDQETMNRLLALDAALCAAESAIGIPGIVRDAITNLQNVWEHHMQPEIDKVYPVWGDFLDAQLSAVRSLSVNPQQFGADAGNS